MTEPLTSPTLRSDAVASVAIVETLAAHHGIPDSAAAELISDVTSAGLTVVDLATARKASSAVRDDALRGELVLLRDEVSRLGELLSTTISERDAAIFAKDTAVSDAVDSAEQLANVMRQLVDARELADRLTGERDRARDLAVRSLIFENDYLRESELPPLIPVQLIRDVLGQFPALASEICGRCGHDLPEHRFSFREDGGCFFGSEPDDDGLLVAGPDACECPGWQEPIA